MKTSFAFTSYLGSYQIFLSSIIGVMLADYYFVRRGYLNIGELFSGSSKGIYYYAHGWNWRAYTAYIAGIVPCFPGFLHAVGVAGIPIGAQRLYVFALPVGIICAAAVYCAINYFWPPPGGLASQWNEVEAGSADSSIIVGEDPERGISEVVAGKSWDKGEL